jgi:alanyl-tRNA synthetase
MRLLPMLSIQQGECETMDAKRLRQLYLDFFSTEKGHRVIRNAPLIPEHDPSVLFTTAGMHPLVPYLLGEPHPAGKRLVNVQKCIRTGDIDEVGDDTHLTFFEMLGNWSLNDYWKPESLTWSYQFLTEWLGLDPNRLFVTCFSGDDDAPRDNDSLEVWQSLGIPLNRVVFLPKDDNWWGPAGDCGPCGPDSEIFYDMMPDKTPGETPETNKRRFWEVWNNVFMEYEKQSDGSYTQMPRRNVDTGMGLERTLAVLQGKSSVYETELFTPILDYIRLRSKHQNDFASRVIADHLRAAVFILAEEIIPGNVDQPYIARRLIRRAVRYGRELGIVGHFLADVAQTVIETVVDEYDELKLNRGHILSTLDDEETRFQRTLAKGETVFYRVVKSQTAEKVLNGETVFHLYDTYGLPPELTQELAAQEGWTTDMDGYREALAVHQEKSRQGAAGRFKGGLSERSPETTRLHTATHLLHAALRQVLGEHVEQRGSNITTERSRFDFSHPTKLTPDELSQVERLVNEQIELDVPVTWVEMSVEEAKDQGAIGLFEARYGERVKVYQIGTFSKEICGGPHVEHTGELGRFKIVKEESAGRGIRRIRAVLE